MVQFFKSVLLGAFLSLLVSLFIGSSGSPGGLLNVKAGMIGDVHFYWSWTLFLIGTALSFAILLLMS